MTMRTPNSDASLGEQLATVIDKLPTPGGLIRSGVAPDHPATKNIMAGFDLHLRDPRVTVLAGVEVGVDVSPEDRRKIAETGFYNHS